MKSTSWRAVAAAAGLLSGCAQVATTPAPEAPASHLAAIPPERIAEFLDDRMTLVLGLTPQQREPVHAINLKYGARGELPEAPFKSVLTPEQLEKFNSMRPDLQRRLEAWAVEATPSSLR